MPPQRLSRRSRTNSPTAWWPWRCRCSTSPGRVVAALNSSSHSRRVSKASLVRQRLAMLRKASTRNLRGARPRAGHRAQRPDLNDPARPQFAAALDAGVCARSLIAKSFRYSKSMNAADRYLVSARRPSALPRRRRGRRAWCSCTAGRSTSRCGNRRRRSRAQLRMRLRYDRRGFGLSTGAAFAGRPTSPTCSALLSHARGS